MLSLQKLNYRIECMYVRTSKERRVLPRDLSPFFRLSTLDDLSRPKPSITIISMRQVNGARRLLLMTQSKRASSSSFLHNRTRQNSSSSSSNMKACDCYYESHGDYERDANELEDASLPLYAQQARLPRLPVPSLQRTLRLFRDSALPLAAGEGEAESLRRALEKFPQQAAAPQRRLERRAAARSSWLQQWWNEQGYLQPRGPNAIHVSYFFRYPLEDPPGTATMSLTERAAAVLRAAAEHAAQVQSGTRAADRLPDRRRTPLCSSQHKYLWGACRIPGAEQDSYRIYHPQPRDNTKHAAVAVKGQFYAVPLTDASTGNRLSQSTLRQSLESIILASSASHHHQSAIPELGWLTTQNRSDWYQDYNLLQAMPGMQKALDKLQSGLLLLCLDDDYADDRDMALRLWHGSSTTNNADEMNRWWDKSMQVVLSANNKEAPETKHQQLGYIGEHSMADGMPAVDLCRQLKRAEYREGNHDVLQQQPSSTPSAQPIFASGWALLSESDRQRIRARVDRAKAKHLDITSQHDLQIQHYKAYGSRKIKALAAVSPDAFVQMAMQLAASRYFRDETVATYESIQTRRFLHGRTETTRTVSPHSVTFCRAMNSKHDDTGDAPQQRLELLRAACDAHSQYSQMAARGMGCDRHFFGLQNCLRENEAPPDLFRHPLFAKSKRWLLSTSTLPGTSPGFGPVQEDGIGVGYDVQPDEIVLTCTCRKQHNDALELSR